MATVYHLFWTKLFWHASLTFILCYNSSHMQIYHHVFGIKWKKKLYSLQYIAIIDQHIFGIFGIFQYQTEFPFYWDAQLREKSWISLKQVCSPTVNDWLIAQFCKFATKYTNLQKTPVWTYLGLVQWNNDVLKCTPKWTRCTVFTKITAH